jgi:UDP-N-acetyl-D-mannosaminuronic acid dehydrogenase
MKIAIVGMGRVGLPLALSFIELGLEVVGVDINAQIAHKINNLRKMPFFEPGYDDIVKSGKLFVSNDYSSLKGADYIIVTVSTPLLTHLEPDLSNLVSAMSEIGQRLEAGQTVIVRSTVPPGTNAWMCKSLEKQFGLKIGVDIFYAYCPERIVEGKAREELLILPQIVGSQDKRSALKAEELFKRFSIDVLHCDFITAELAKLFTNISRYITFAISNYLATIALDYGVDFYELAKLVNYKYPRPIPSHAGFTGGSCLRKDFAMVNEGNHGMDIGLAAWRVNETFPVKLVEAVEKAKGPISGKHNVVLGYTFKRDSDDARDSLVPKFIRQLLRRGALVTVVDPYVVENDIVKWPDVQFTKRLDKTLSEADIVWIVVNHTIFEEYKTAILSVAERGGLVVDVWNCLGLDRMFIQKEEKKCGF